MSKQPDAVRRTLRLGRPLQCDDDDDFIECVSASRPPVPVLAKGLSVVSSDSGCIVAGGRFRGDDAMDGDLQREETQSESEIN